MTHTHTTHVDRHTVTYECPQGLLFGDMSNKQTPQLVEGALLPRQVQRLGITSKGRRDYFIEQCVCVHVRERELRANPTLHTPCIAPHLRT